MREWENVVNKEFLEQHFEIEKNIQSRNRYREENWRKKNKTKKKLQYELLSSLLVGNTGVDLGDFFYNS